jgi:hypothetical protein
MMKYPPIMSPVKNSDGNVTHYEGYTADFIYYIAKHFEWRYVAFYTGWVKRTYKKYLVSKSIGSLKFIEEDQFEVAKEGQVLTALRAVATKESYIIKYKTSMNKVIWFYLFVRKWIFAHFLTNHPWNTGHSSISQVWRFRRCMFF